MAGGQKIKTRKIRNGIVVKEDPLKKVNGVNKNDSISDKRVKTRKIRMTFSRNEEKKLDQDIERDDNISIMLIIIILAVCFIVGITLGFFLYKIAITGVI